MSANVEDIQSAQPLATPPEAAPAPPPSAPPPSQAPAAPAKPETRRDIIEKALNNRGQHAQFQPRQQGKFAGPPSGAPPAPAASASAVPEVAAPTPPVRPDMPKSLKLDLKQHWEATHPDLATAIHQRELDYEKGVLPLKEKARLADELMSEFKPYEAMLRMENASPKQTVGELLRVAAIFRQGSPVQKAQTVAHFMRQFGVPLEHIQQVLSGNAPPQPALDPQYQQLSQQVQQLTQLQQQQVESRALAEIRAFEADPAHKHFAAVSDRMVALLQSPEVLGPDAAQLTERERLKLAYDTAIRLDPVLSQQFAAEQLAAERAKSQAAHARQAAVQVHGGPPLSPAPQVDSKDRRAFIASQLAKR